MAWAPPAIDVGLKKFAICICADVHLPMNETDFRLRSTHLVFGACSAVTGEPVEHELVGSADGPRKGSPTSKHFVAVDGGARETSSMRERLFGLSKAKLGVLLSLPPRKSPK